MSPDSASRPNSDLPTSPPPHLSLGLGRRLKRLSSPRKAGRGAGIGLPPRHSHPGVRLLLEIQLLRLGSAAGRAVQSHVTADNRPGLPRRVGWKRTRTGSERTQDPWTRAPGKLSFRRQRAQRGCACESSRSRAQSAILPAEMNPHPLSAPSP